MIKLAEGDLKEKILTELAERSETIESGEWYDRWKNAVDTDFGWYVKAIGYKDASEQDRHRLAHYLDCEAHHDILVELFKTAHQKKKNY